jgi:hypothetical protein
MRNLEGLKHYETKELSNREPALVNGVNPVHICSSYPRAKQILPLEIIPLSDLGLNRNEIL